MLFKLSDALYEERFIANLNVFNGYNFDYTVIRYFNKTLQKRGKKVSLLILKMQVTKLMKRL